MVIKVLNDVRYDDVKVTEFNPVLGSQHSPFFIIGWSTELEIKLFKKNCRNSLLLTYTTY